jgi:TonB family protein
MIPKNHHRLTEVPILPYGQGEGDERRNRRIALTVAVLLHGALLTLPLPNPATEALESMSPVTGIQVTSCDFGQRPPAVTERPRPRVLKVPIPIPPSPEIFHTEERLNPQWKSDPPPLDIPPGPPRVSPDAPLRVGGDVRPPVRIHSVAPKIPDFARRACIRGTAILSAVIDRDGKVLSARILRGMPLGLNEAALDAVLQWKFEPATLHGRPVTVRYPVAVTFDWWSPAQVDLPVPTHVSAPVRALDDALQEH